MTSSHKSCFTSKVHFHIEYDMALDPLEATKLVNFVRPCFFGCHTVNWDICDLSLAHFFGNSIGPVCISILVIDSQGLCNRFRDSYPKLVRCLPVFFLTLFTIRFRFCMTSDTHHLNAGVSSIRFKITYSANSMGLLSFTSFKGNHAIVPSVNSTSIFQPAVVFFGCRWLPLM